MRIFRLTRRIVIIAEAGAQRLGRVDLPAALGQQVADHLTVGGTLTRAEAQIAPLPGAEGEQPIQGVALGVGAGAHTEAAILAAAAGEQAVAARFPRRQQIGGIHRLVGDDTPQGPAAIQ